LRECIIVLYLQYMLKLNFKLVFYIALFLTCNVAYPNVVETDICVYGGTSGGVISAVQASRMGKTAVLLVFGNHVGGMTSGGLGWTDYGNQNAIGGMSREFYQRVGRYYGKSIQWTFEPHVAEKVFLDMLNEANVIVRYRQRLAGIKKEGGKIVEISMEDGSRYRAKMFIDATYEGDLMAMAGVSFTVGREGTNVYGESLNGIRPNTPNHQFVVDVDPYRVIGDPSSGLLPYIQPGDGGRPGDGDHRVQAYNFRLCLTQVETNKIPITAPPNYDPEKYELLARYISARLNAGHSLNLKSFLKIDSMPNGKTDINNNGAFSTDFIGMNYTYPTNNYIEREKICKEHEYYIKGLLYFLATDPRVPANVRSEMQSYGFCKDEFIDTGGWPHQLYVREARRMISDYVMTQADCQGNRIAYDSVGLGSYTMDSHNCQRIVQNGVVKNEGDVQSGVPRPYPISYRSIVPKKEECENLFVTFALSASHIAFGSIRMEPVFMILSQSAATAASFAIDDRIPVQQVNYEKLKIQLMADKQLLMWGSDSGSASGIIIDNSDTNGVILTGEWTASTSKSGFWGINYFHDGNTNKGQKSVQFVPTIPSNAMYEVYLRWTEDPNRADNVPVYIIHSSGTNIFYINQKTNGGKWIYLMTAPFRVGTNGSVLIRTDSTTGYVIADAVRFVPTGYQDLPEVQLIATKPIAAESGDKTGLITFMRKGDTNSELIVRYSVSGTASNGIDYAELTGALKFSPGESFAFVPIEAIRDSIPEGDESLIISLEQSSSYTIGSFSNAIVTIEDMPYSKWKLFHFTQDEMANQEIIGDNADPDGDGIVNIKEYVLGLNPKLPELNYETFPSARWKNNFFILTIKLNKNASDYDVLFEYSDDLIKWNSGEYFLKLTVLDIDDDYKTMEVVLDPANRNSGFIRWTPVPKQ